MVRPETVRWWFPKLQLLPWLRPNCECAVGDYRKLEVWKLGCVLSDRVDVVVADLPRRVRDGLGDQLARAAESIHLNIAEGCGFSSDPQLGKYVRQSLGSANEVEDALNRLHRRGLLKPHDHDLLNDATVLRKKLGAFLKALS